MKRINILLSLLTISTLSFAQAREDRDEGYKKIYSILLIKDGEVKHTINQGAEINAKVDKEWVNGRWFFKSYPDVVELIDREAVVIGEIILNEQKPLRIETPQPKGGMSVGIGMGPVGVSTGMGGGMQSFNMEKWKAEISERMETKEEKLKREHYERKEQERLAKQAAKEAKKAAKKKKKN